jgi:hypothetical protein
MMASLTVGRLNEFTANSLIVPSQLIFKLEAECYGFSASIRGFTESFMDPN